MLRITLKKEGRGKTVLFLEGKLYRENINALFEVICAERLRRSNIILDFEKVTYIDEQAVRMIKKFSPEEVQIRNCSLFICAMLGIRNGVNHVRDKH